MKARTTDSRALFREVGAVPTRSLSDRLWGLLWPVLSITSLLALLVLAGYWDARAEQQLQLAETRRAVALAQAYRAGLRQGQADMLATAEAGWSTARLAAAEAQSCQAVRGRP